jgi:hypothetical protein
MSDLTPEVLDELERRTTDAISMMGRAPIIGNLQFMEAVEPHISDLIEAARERDRLRAILAEARTWIASETEGATGRYASSLVGDIDAALERKDGGQCSTQQN